MTLRAEAITVRFGAIEAVREVTASLSPGAITAVIGPNAAGKSTLLRALVGVVRPEHGRVRLGDLDVHRATARAIARRLAYVAQRPVVAAPFSAREVVALGRYAAGRNERRVRAAIDELDLGALADRPFATLSVGQQQMVTLARAFAQVPDDGVLVLDEPTSAMDLRHVRQVAARLRDRRRRGLSILIAAHDLTIVGALADEVWIMVDGRLVEAGPTDVVLSPDRLERAFGVPFTRLARPDGGTILTTIPSPEESSR
ncbi:MAG: ABC transporter ATP-binding protein [Phycisphaerales bacterium]|nr:ABC transporter ATP-binding protein [Phycisphaerales bacterium]